MTICISCNEMGVSASCGVCRWCSEEAPFNMETPNNTIVGCLLDGNFYCDDCASWFPDTKTVPVYRVNISFYSQVCTCCRKVIVAGATPVVLLPCRFEDSRAVLQ